MTPSQTAAELADYKVRHCYDPETKSILLRLINALTASSAEIERLRNQKSVVWATDNAPFTGKQVKDLLDENDRLRAENARLDLIARERSEFK